MPARRCHVRSRTSSRSGPCPPRATAWAPRVRPPGRRRSSRRSRSGACSAAPIHACCPAGGAWRASRAPGPSPAGRRDVGASAAAPGRRFIGHHQIRRRPEVRPAQVGAGQQPQPFLDHPAPERERSGRGGRGSRWRATRRELQERHGQRSRVLPGKGLRREGLGARGQGGRESGSSSALARWPRPRVPRPSRRGDVNANTRGISRLSAQGGPFRSSSADACEPAARSPVQGPGPRRPRVGGRQTGGPARCRECLTAAAGPGLVRRLD